MIVEDNFGAAVISEPCVGPSVMTDDGRGWRKLHYLHGGEVIQVLRVAGKVGHRFPNQRDRTSVEIVVAQDEIDRLLDRFRNVAEVKANIVAFGNVPADCHGVRSISNGGQEIVHAGRVNEIQVDVGQPSKSHWVLPSGRFASY